MGINSLVDNAVGAIQANPLTTALGVGTVVAGGVVVGAALSGSKTKRKARTKRGRSRDRKYISKQKHERRRKRKTPGKIYKRKGLFYSRTKKVKKKNGKKRTGKIYYTKKGQPYKILANGRARFVKGKRRK